MKIKSESNDDLPLGKSIKHSYVYHSCWICF